MDAFLEELGWLRLKEVRYPKLGFGDVFEFFLPRSSTLTRTNGSRIVPRLGYMAGKIVLLSLIPQLSVGSFSQRAGGYCHSEIF